MNALRGKAVINALANRSIDYGNLVRTFSKISRRKIHVLRRPQDIRKVRHTLRDDKRTVGFVPTMGALHEGHLALARAAAAENDEVFISIFVNPTQFGVSEDLGSYPRTFDSDMVKLVELNDSLIATKNMGRITTVFAPTTKDIYPSGRPSSEINGDGSFITITPLSRLLEGRTRPVFFRGVATVCMKLFNVVQPDRVYFGQKDVQQTVVVKQLVTDFHLDTTVRVLPTEREPDNLAMSSRNVFLGARRRAAATVVPQSLRIAEQEYLMHDRLKRDEILDPAQVFLHESRKQASTEHGVDWELDYLSLAQLDTMNELDHVDPQKGAILSIALKMLPMLDVREDEETADITRSVRLIDNIILPPRPG